MDIRKQLMRMGSTNPGLRPHITAVLAHMAGSAPVRTKTASALEKLEYMSEEQVQRAWGSGNNRAEGYPVAEAFVSPRKQIKQIARDLRLPYLYDVGVGDDAVHLFGDDRRVVGVGDAHGPWAVDII